MYNATRHLVLLFLLFAQNLHAEEFAITGGDSPDRRYTILLVSNSPSANTESNLANYKVVFRDNQTKTTQPLKAGPQDFCSFVGAQEPVNRQAWWNPDSNTVALCFRTTGHSRETYLYSVFKGTIHRVSLPDYDAVIYGRLGVKPFNGHYVRCPTKWADAYTLNLLAWGDMNECYITLHIQNRRNHIPTALLVSVTKGKPLEG